MDLAKEIAIQESLTFKMKNNRSDILILKEKIENLKRKNKHCDITLHESEYKIDRCKLLHDKYNSELSKYVRETQDKKAHHEISVDSLFAQNINDEMSLYEDRIILDEIKDHEARIEKEKAEELERKRIALEVKKQNAADAEAKRKKKANSYLKTELEKKRHELAKIMARMKVSQPEKILDKVSEMTGVKDGLLDLISNYKNEIAELKDDIESLRVVKKQQNIEGGELTLGDNCPALLRKSGLTINKSVVDFEAKEANQLDNLEENISKLNSVLYENELKYKRFSNILSSTCTSVSRIMYQLQTFQREKNIEISNTNVVEYLSHIGLK